MVSLVVLGLIVGRGCRREPEPLVIHRPVATSATDASASPSPVAVVEQLYTCGARTKKGTPCSRRVHGPVRCWQHKGAKAMLPDEKLVIKE